MKKLLLFFAFLSFQAAVLYGQTLTGTWQGVLKRPEAPNGEQRIMIKVSTTEADKLAATMYFINGGASTLVPSSAVTAKDAGLKMSFERINGAWEGRLSADGKTLDGTWTQDEPRPLVLTRATAETAWTIPDPPAPRQMMDPKAAPGFEVATIKPSNPDNPGNGFRVGVNRSGTITALNSTLFYLVTFAYDLHPKQVIGAPAWIDADKFDITAKPDQPGSDRQAAAVGDAEVAGGAFRACLPQGEEGAFGLHHHGGEGRREDQEGRGHPGTVSQFRGASDWLRGSQCDDGRICHLCPAAVHGSASGGPDWLRRNALQLHSEVHT